jgi:hypothetical protein
MMRVVALSNEHSPGADPDIPWALAKLQSRGKVTAYSVYSLPSRVKALGAPNAAREVSEVVRGLTADAVLFFHSGSCCLSARELDVLREASGDAVWMYREGDAFHRWMRPYRQGAIATLSRCDAAFLFCGGYMGSVARRAGCRFVTYAPSWVNTDRFPVTWSSSGFHANDVVFVGNNVRGGLRPFPGARQRRRLVSSLEKRYGSRLAVYGRGWHGTSSKGPCPFDEVGSVYGESSVCVGSDHTMGTYQFSNRLPIALASGIPLVHSRMTGWDEVLRDLNSWQLFQTDEAAVVAIDRILDLDQSASGELSALQRRVAERFSCDVVVEHMLEVGRAVLEGVDCREVPNPWLKNAYERL